ncbi:MAG: putative rane protein [Gemmatimonadetes bacterium]|nr:putative rane protein [Gemmatimonadota bacterium]
MNQLLSLAWRESRTARRRLLLYMSAILFGVAALVAIDSFAENLTRGVHEQARALLGGDVSLRSREKFQPKPTALLDSLNSSGIPVSRQVSFSSMALVPRTSGTRLVQVRAVSAGYPWYGTVETKPASAYADIQGDRRAVVDPAVLVSLDAHIGDTLSLGTGRFLITGTIESVPGDAGISAAIGPRVFIPEKYLDETGLLVFGSRAEYEALIKLPATLSPARFAGRFNPRLSSDRVRLRTVTENEMDMTQAITQMRDFLGVVGLVALLLGGIGVASGVHAFVMRKIDVVAILRCVGATSRQVLTIYVLQAIAMGLIGAGVGAMLGVAIQLSLPRVLKDFLPVDIDVRVVPSAVLTGLAIGIWVSLAFALRPLLALRLVSPLQALRRENDAEVMRRARRDPASLIVSLGIAASVLILGLSRADNAQRGFAYSGGIAVALGVLWLTAAFLTWAARRVVRPSWPFVLRQGLAALHRPGNQTRSVILALGFGVFLMSTLYQVQKNLLKQFDIKLEQSQANAVFLDVQEKQAPGVDSLLRGLPGVQVTQQVPIIPMRIYSINGVLVSTMLAGRARERGLAPSAPDSGAELPQRGKPGAQSGRRSPWALRREFRSTYRDTPVGSEVVTSGKFWTASDSGGVAQISVEKDLASELGVVVGDSMTWDIQGVRVPTRITSTREVNWARFEPNFFVVFQTRALAHAPKQFVFLANIPGARAVALAQRAVVQKFPNVSSLDLTSVQQTVKSVLGKVTVAVRFMAILSLTLGIPVLFSAVSATRRARLREGVLLKVLGATRRHIGRILLSEYVLLGALGALAGVGLSIGGAWALMHWVFDTPFTPALVPAAVVAVAMMTLSAVIGLLTSREVFASTPMEALRES